MTDDLAEMQQLANHLLANAGWGEATRVAWVTGGRNNRTCRVEHADGIGLLKRYVPDDRGRQRFLAETTWLSFCQLQGIAAVPRLWAADESQRCALLEWISGEPCEAGTVTVDEVAQAIHFAADVNQHRSTVAAQTLPLAAEACDSLQTHLAVVERRLERLSAATVSDDLGCAFQTWLSQELRPTWNDTRAVIDRRHSPAELTGVLPGRQRRLSPSDFGFHNALRTPTGALCFLDFEYAGWDDPAKLICDFYWQVDRPAPRETLPQWFPALADGDDIAPLAERVACLFPVYGVKWCTIVLNEFLSAGQARRSFAGRMTDDARVRQWDLARRLLDDLRKLPR